MKFELLIYVIYFKIPVQEAELNLLPFFPNTRKSNNLYKTLLQ